MILDMPYLFNAQVKPPRSGKARPISTWDTTPIEVREVAGAEAPVAIEWVHNQSYDGTDIEGEPRITARRWHEDRLFKPVEMDDGSPMPVDVFAKALVTRRYFALPPTGPVLSQWSYPKLPGEPPHERLIPTKRPSWNEFIEICKDEKSRIVGDDREEKRVESAVILSGAFLIVDGAVWTSFEASEPHYRLSSGATPQWEVVLHPGPLRYCAEFSATSVDHLRTYMARMGMDLHCKDEIRILVPEALQLDDVQLAARQALCCLALNVVNKAESWPTEAAYLIERLREIRDAKILGMSEAVEVLDSYERLQPLLEHLPATSDAAEMMKHVEPVVWRWREQELARRPELSDLLDDARAREQELASIVL